jgi:PIN domain nuclease of toxin-antitoxin system
MRLLLDAHALVWWLSASERLGERARDAITDETNDAVVGIGTIWELAIKRSLQKQNWDRR